MAAAVVGDKERVTEPLSPVSVIHLEVYDALSVCILLKNAFSGFLRFITEARKAFSQCNQVFIKMNQLFEFIRPLIVQSVKGNGSLKAVVISLLCPRKLFARKEE